AVKWICGTEQDHLRCLHCCREMHRGRINCNQKTCLSNERCQRKQISFSRKIDHWLPHLALDLGDMCLLESRSPAGQNKIDLVVPAGVFDHRCPARWLPEFFLPGRTGMKNDETIADLWVAPELVCPRAARFRDLQMQNV